MALSDVGQRPVWISPQQPSKLRAPLRSSIKSLGLNLLSMKIINKQSIRRIEKSFIGVKLRISPEAHFPDDSEKLLLRSKVFSTVLYLVRTKNIKQVRVTFIQGFKKKKEQPSMYTASQHGLGTWEGSLIIKGGPTLISQEGRHLIFLFLTWTFFTSGQCALFLNN